MRKAKWTLYIRELDGSQSDIEGVSNIWHSTIMSISVISIFKNISCLCDFVPTYPTLPYSTHCKG